MQIQFETFTVNKRFPLTISYGTTAQSTNVWVKIIEDGIEGWGEATPFRAAGNLQTTEMIQNSLSQVIPMLEVFNPYQRQEIEQILLQNKVPSAVRAAIDVALYDWLGKSVNLPLWKMWGLNRNAIASTSVTIGISTPEAAKIRVRKWLEYADIRVLKVKLGSPEGIIADQQMFLAVQEEAPKQEIFIDANGGWNLADAVVMGKWLAQQGVKYLEQPLAKGNEIELLQLKQQQPLPIFVDESCFTSMDIPKLADSIDGINIKLMKSGGLTEAMRMISIARTLNLQVMFGCYSDSTLVNTAAAQLSPLADYLDLDSHLNLLDDPFCGAILHEGRIFPNDLPGLGVKYRAFSA
ncbi:dipeptide epimerase [Calothrix sp. PCC 6303]|uniref:dipeptide epimerase n=1 Tax=Calothrix sp. PCC 6303 TaxID=1170562 RepID=UPI0002A04B4B|nr:dipeptide epimerase [Calothrix sp. PCC 6303]AFZ04199.1 Mandelate racemase/muconate lactonizing protein [Calothrix sp. PCC 6303]